MRPSAPQTPQIARQGTMDETSGPIYISRNKGALIIGDSISLRRTAPMVAGVRPRQARNKAQPILEALRNGRMYEVGQTQSIV